MPTIFCRLASPDRFAKDIGVFAVVISQLEFSDIERQIFLVHFMELPTMPRLKVDQKPSMIFVWMLP